MRNGDYKRTMRIDVYSLPPLAALVDRWMMPLRRVFKQSKHLSTASPNSIYQQISSAFGILGVEGSPFGYEKDSWMLCDIFGAELQLRRGYLQLG